MKVFSRLKIQSYISKHAKQYGFSPNGKADKQLAELENIYEKLNKLNKQTNNQKIKDALKHLDNVFSDDNAEYDSVTIAEDVHYYRELLDCFKNVSSLKKTTADSTIKDENSLINNIYKLKLDAWRTALQAPTVSKDIEDAIIDNLEDVFENDSKGKNKRREDIISEIKKSKNKRLLKEIHKNLRVIDQIRREEQYVIVHPSMKPYQGYPKDVRKKDMEMVKKRIQEL